MPLRWDPLLVRELARELDGRLRGERVRAARFDGDAREMALLMREETLVWGLHPARGFLRMLPPAEPAPTDLRIAARIRAVRAPVDERILIVELVPARAGPPLDLVVELLGNQLNAVIVDAGTHRMRHVLVRRGEPRPIEPGAEWSPPPSSGRQGAHEPLDRAGWLDLVEPAPPPDRVRTLVSAVAWTSSINAGPLLDAEGGLGEAWELWRRLAHGDEPAEPCVLSFPGGPQPYPWPLPGVTSEGAPSLLEAFGRAAAEASEGRGDEVLLPPGLLRRLEGALDEATRRLTSVRAELEGTPQPSALRGVGDLLLARLREVPAGVERARLRGFDGADVEVALDPARSPQENAASYYARAGRAERARERLPGLAEAAEEEVARLDSLVARARSGEAGLEELRAAVPDRPSKGDRDAGPTLPYRSYRSSGGLEIRVGRGARHNDDLTFHHSAPDDVFLHARHAAGAHVILRWNGPGNPPARDLQEAAVLAALHSKARTSGSAPVDWTLRKYVRKPRRAPAGTVTVERVRTLFVEPDPILLERLAPGEGDDG